MGPDEEFGAAEELAETPEAIEMHAVLWHVARCIDVEDFVRASEDFGEELRTLEEQEQHEELAVRALKNLAMRALKILAVRALLRNLAVRAHLVKHLACERASLPLTSLA